MLQLISHIVELVNISSCHLSGNSQVLYEEQLWGTFKIHDTLYFMYFYCGTLIWLQEEQFTDFMLYNMLICYKL